MIKKGKYPEAKLEFDEGMRRDPYNVMIQSNRCYTYMMLKEYNIALKAADECIRLDKTFPIAYAHKGNCHFLRDEYI